MCVCVCVRVCACVCVCVCVCESNKLALDFLQHTMITYSMHMQTRKVYIELWTTLPGMKAIKLKSHVHTFN